MSSLDALRKRIDAMIERIEREQQQQQQPIRFVPCWRDEPIDPDPDVKVIYTSWDTVIMSEDA